MSGFGSSGRRQPVDPRALASRPLRRSEPELSAEAQRVAQERRQRQREQFERNNAATSQVQATFRSAWHAVLDALIPTYG